MLPIRLCRLSVIVALCAVAVAGCASVDDKGAQALASAGQSAADALSTQATATRKLVRLNQQSARVKEALACRFVKASLQEGCLKSLPPANPDLDAKLRQIADIISKRQLAFDALKDAYAAFAALVAYDARGEVDKSFTAVGGTLDSLLTAVAVPPGMSTVMQKAAGDVLGIAATYQKNKQILIASQALHQATDKLALALNIERDKVAQESLLTTLVAEQDSLYGALIENELVAPRDILGQLISKEFPATVPAAAPPGGETAIVRAAARISYMETSAERQRAAVQAYGKALEALAALSAQHAQLEAGAPLDIATLIARAKELQQLVGDFSHI